MSTEAAPEHFKPYTPNANTKLGRAYLYAVKELSGSLLVVEANFLRENPLLWLRALSLYSSNLDFSIRQHKIWLKALAPMPGEPQTAEYQKEVRNNKAASLAREHILQRARARRAELVIEVGYEKLTDARVVGDVVAAFTDIIAALRQEDHLEAARLAEYWVFRLTGQETGDADAVEPAVAETNPLQDLLSKLRKGRDASQD